MVEQMVDRTEQRHPFLTTPHWTLEERGRNSISYGSQQSVVLDALRFKMTLRMYEQLEAIQGES
jgi:hypothetical protein